jgi:hypothetical protein
MDCMCEMTDPVWSCIQKLALTVLLLLFIPAAALARISLHVWNTPSAHRRYMPNLCSSGGWAININAYKHSPTWPYALLPPLFSLHLPRQPSYSQRPQQGIHGDASL